MILIIMFAEANSGSTGWWYGTNEKTDGGPGWWNDETISGTCKFLGSLI